MYRLNIDEETLYSTDFLTDSSWHLAFSDCLTSLIQDHGYTGDPGNVDACVSFLQKKYEDASIPITKTTLKSWFSGESRPFYERRSRERMYELCFALHMNYTMACRFFEKVYFSRCFNCRSIQEAAYCYCFSKEQDYLKARQLYKQAMAIPPQPSAAKKPIPFTHAMEKDILSLETDQDFLDYIKENQSSFAERNQSARRELVRLTDRLKGTREDRELVNLHRKNNTPFFDTDRRKLTGLTVREFFFYHDNCEYLKGQNVSSFDFMLSQIFGINLVQYYKTEPQRQSFSKNAALTELARINFPSKQIFCDILKNKDNVSFDAIRKMLILLHFYTFFVSLLLDKNNHAKTDILSAYTEDANDELTECGYGPLFPKHPYDCMFLYCAGSAHPLDTFRNLILEVIGFE